MNTMSDATTALIERWSVHNSVTPFRVVCFVSGWPAKCWDPADPDGPEGETAHQQYENHVFDTEEQAIEKARRSALAAVSFATRSLRDARVKLAECVEECAKAAEEVDAVERYVRAKEVPRG